MVISFILIRIIDHYSPICDSREVFFMFFCFLINSLVFRHNLLSKKITWYKIQTFKNMSALIIDFGWILNKEVRKSLPYSKTVKSILSFFSIRLLIQELSNFIKTQGALNVIAILWILPSSTREGAFYETNLTANFQFCLLYTRL